LYGCKIKLGAISLYPHEQAGISLPQIN
ncbi:MAG: hypothetical protein RLZZ574_2346, partial [Cyanobacteriota bacterium]